jgi:hypothetical protein
MARPARIRPIELIGPVAALALLVGGASAAYGEMASPAADPPAPTVTFTSGPLAPLVCGSKPDVTTMTIVEGGRVNLVNHIGSGAVMDIGGASEATVPDGEGASVQLRAGRHTVRLLPDCPAHGQIVALTVDVEPLPGPPLPGPSTSPGPSPSAGPVPEATRGTRGTGPGDGWDGVRAERSNPDNRLAAGGDGRTGGGGSTLPGDSPILAMNAFGSDRPGDRRMGLLLGVIAAICVCGVTAALIRAILTQRASRMVSP